MNRSNQINGRFWCIVLIAFLTNIHISSGQAKKEQQYPIPDTINTIFQTSCMSCHGFKGGRFPKSRLNLSRWAMYGAAKEKEKASLICTTLSKGAMPPKSIRKSKPGLIPTKEQIDLICRWAESLKSRKAEKKIK